MPAWTNRPAAPAPRRGGLRRGNRGRARSPSRGGTLIFETTVRRNALERSDDAASADADSDAERMRACPTPCARPLSCSGTGAARQRPGSGAASSLRARRSRVAPPCQSIFAASPATMPRPSSCPAIRCARATLPRPSSTCPRQVNGERGMLGFTGTFEGSPISVQSSGMGCPSAAIVVEELVQLGVKRIVRVGTCGGLQADMHSAISCWRSRPCPAMPRCSPTPVASRMPPRPTSSWCTPPRAPGQARRDEDPRRPVRVLEHVLRPRRRPRAALVGSRRARGRDGGGDPLHDCGSASHPGRVPLDGVGRHRGGEFVRITDAELERPSSA